MLVMDGRTQGGTDEYVDGRTDGRDGCTNIGKYKDLPSGVPVVDKNVIICVYMMFSRGLGGDVGLFVC